VIRSAGQSVTIDDSRMRQGMRFLPCKPEYFNMTDRMEFTIRNTRAELTSLIQRVNKLLEPRRLPERAVYVVNLVLEEILTNIIKYGYDDETVHRIDVRLDFFDDEIRIEFEDYSHEFNPLSVHPPDLTRPTLESQPGGLGIQLVRNMTESIEYKRENNRNFLKVRIGVGEE